METDLTLSRVVENIRQGISHYDNSMSIKRGDNVGGSQEDVET